MKYLIRLLLLPALALLPARADVNPDVQPASSASGGAAACMHTHAVAYAGLAKQPVLRIKVTAAKDGNVTSFSLNSGKTTLVSDMTNVQLYYSGSTPYFSINASGGAQAKPAMNKLAKAAKTMTFTGSQALQAGDNYFWVTCTVSSRARGNNKIDAACDSVVLDGSTIVPSAAGADEGCMEVYPYKFRIAPYYRTVNLMNWNPNHLTAEHFKMMTDIIYCQVRVNAAAEVIEDNAPGGGPSTMAAGLAKLKQLRGSNKVGIILCLMPNRDIMRNIVASDALRITFAKNLADYVKNNGYDGVDLDWEYPTDSTQWSNYIKFVSSLREELGGKGTISAAVTPQYNGPNAVFCDLLDFINTMSYDRGGNHSTMASLTEDVTYCKNTLKMPACKIVGGLPFYSNETASNRNWDAQMGYANIINLFPTIGANVNTFIHPKTGRQHYFNGTALLQSKCRYIVAQKFGGVMIWAYDTDLPITHPKSAAKAMYMVIKQSRR